MGRTYRGPKSGSKMVTLFGDYSYDGVSAGVWVIHTEVPNLGARWSRFLAVTLMMVFVLVYWSYIQRSQIRVQGGHAFWWLLL